MQQLCHDTIMLIEVKAISVGEFGGIFGFITFPLIAVLLIQIFTWKFAWLFAGISILIIFIPMYFYLLRDQSSRHKEFLNKTDILSLKKNWRRRDVIVDKKFYIYLPISLVPSFVTTGLVFHQVFIAANKGWDMKIIGIKFCWSWNIFNSWTFIRRSIY